jgi:hypothetical protein
MTDVISINRFKRRGCTAVHTYFERTRSTVTMASPSGVFSFEVPRTEAVALHTRLADSPANEARVLVEFIERWRLQ